MAKEIVFTNEKYIINIVAIDTFILGNGDAILLIFFFLSDGNWARVRGWLKIVSTSMTILNWLYIYMYGIIYKFEQFDIRKNFKSIIFFLIS